MSKWLQHPSKYFVTSVLYILAVAILVFFAFGDYLRMAGYLLSFLFIVLPSYLYTKLEKFQAAVQEEFLNLSQIFIAFCVFANLLGSLDFYKNPDTWWYDTVAHLINSSLIFIISPLLVMLFQRHFFKRISLSFTLVGNFIIIIFGSFFWEFYESLVDSIFTHATMFGQLGEYYFDTLTDLAADLVGGLLASLLIYQWFYGYILSKVKSQK